jgi:hypothetical protein
MNHDTTTKYLIISHDGGGIRGLITALLLKQLSSDFLSQAYLFAGTSTGGIIALGLASGVPVSQMVDLYETKGADIFKPSPCRSELPSGAPPDLNKLVELARKSGQESWEAFLAEIIGDIVCVAYTNSGLRSTLENVLGAKANQTLGALKGHVAVTTFQLSVNSGPWAPLTPHNIAGIDNNPTLDTTVIDAAMSTSAAPTYFPPYKHPKFGFCVDGGLVANNPSTLEVTTLIQSGVPVESIWMLSLGTGNTVNSIPAPIAEALVDFSVFGPLAWLFPWATGIPDVYYTPAVPLLSAFFDGASAIDSYQSSQLLGPRRYKRAEVPLKGAVALDDFSPKGIKLMEDSVTDYLKSKEWQDILGWIRDNFGSGR